MSGGGGLFDMVLLLSKGDDTWLDGLEKKRSLD